MSSKKIYFETKDGVKGWAEAYYIVIDENNESRTAVFFYVKFEGKEEEWICYECSVRSLKVLVETVGENL